MNSTGPKVRTTNFIDFALYILNAKPLEEFERLVNEWNIAINEETIPDPDASPPILNRLHRVRDFAKKEGFNMALEECLDAIDFWDKFKLNNPSCEIYTAGGPVAY